LIWLTLAGSFVSIASILLIRVAILASAAICDSKNRSPPFEAIDYEFMGDSKDRTPFEAMDCEFLGFSEVGSHCRVFSARSSNKCQP